MLTQEKLLRHLKKEFLTVQQVAKKYNISIQAVYKTLNKLKKKGVVFGSSGRGFNFQSTSTPTTQKGFNKKVIRLHGQEFNLKIKFKGYLDLPSIDYLDKNTIRFYKNSIEVYVKHSFYGYSPIEARNKSIRYMKRFITMLQDKYYIIVKNIRQVNAHYSEEENELSKDFHAKKKKLSIRSETDDKIWAKIDFSLNVNEFEFIDPNKSFEDTQKLTDFFNDVREHELVTISEIKLLMANMLKITSRNVIAIKKIERRLD